MWVKVCGEVDFFLYIVAYNIIFNLFLLPKPLQAYLLVPILAGQTDFGPWSRFPDFMRQCTDFGRCGNF